MKRLFDLFRVTSQANALLCNYLPQRGVQYQQQIKWVKPEKKPVYHPSVTGDLESFPQSNLDELYVRYRNSKELETADEKVKKLFSLRYNPSNALFQHYKKELVDRVKNHEFDNNSLEVRIASLTAKVRYYQNIIMNSPVKLSRLSNKAKLTIDKRKKMLKELRMKDYQKFEWLLEKLDLEYRPPVGNFEAKVTRKRSLLRLAKLKVLQAKEEKLANLKKEFDEKKVPFLEKKILKLKEIKELEEKHNLPSTVSEEDINETIKKLEKVKIEIAERAKWGYKRKIHPFLLEPYEEHLLLEKEKAGELITGKPEDVKSQEKMTEGST